MKGRHFVATMLALTSPFLAGAGSCGHGGGPVCPQTSAMRAAVAVPVGGGQLAIGRTEVQVEDDRFVVRVRIDDQRYTLRDLWLSFWDLDAGLEAHGSTVETRRAAMEVPCDNGDCSTHCGDRIGVRADMVIGWDGYEHVRSAVTTLDFVLPCATPQERPDRSVTYAATGGDTGGDGPDSSCPQE